MVRVVYAPRGRTAEAFRAVRTALYFSGRGANNRVIQVTSPSPADGKSTLAANLAASVAESGKKALLIDADFRRPRVHEYFRVSTNIGMNAVLTGEAELQDAICTTPIHNLDVLPCGNRPDNPAELLTNVRFQQLLEVVKEKYDMIIIDTPPVLAVTDPVVVAPCVDAVLLVIRLSRVARHQIRRSLALLSSVGAQVSGVVVNAVGGDTYAYGSAAGLAAEQYGYQRGMAFADPYSSYYGEEQDALDSRPPIRAVAVPANGKAHR